MRQGKAWVKGQARRLDKGMSNFRGEGIRRTMTEQNKIEINHVGWEFSVEQDGMVVASGEAPTEESARREAAHYALMYSQDGPVKVSIKEVQGTPTVPRGGKAQDDCEVCHGTKGGVPGNENIVDGKVICDYCHAEHLTSKAQEPDLPEHFGELPERTRPSIFDGMRPLTEEDKKGYSEEQWAEIIAENSGGSDGDEAGGAAGEDRRTVEAVSKGDDGVESGAVGVGEQKGVDV